MTITLKGSILHVSDISLADTEQSCYKVFTMEGRLSLFGIAASLFGELWRLEPLSHERRIRWRREMEWLLSVSDHIVELVPSWQSFPDGSSTEV